MQEEWVIGDHRILALTCFHRARVLNLGMKLYA